MKIGDAVKKQCPLNESTWQTLKDFNIEKKTHRGCRAGTNKQRQIIPLITVRTGSFYNKNKTNKSNLVKIPFVHPSYSSHMECRFALWNAASIKKNNCSTSLIDFIVTNRLDMLAITETWLKGDDRDSRVLADLANSLLDFDVHHVPRANGTAGGGICIIIRKGFEVIINKCSDFTSFEHMDLTVNSASKSLRLVVIYRPPPSKKNNTTASMFLNEFSTLIERLSVIATSILLTGDFNIHVDDTNDTVAKKFLDMLVSADLRQLVTGSTHRHGHTLDLLITRQADDTVHHIELDHSLPSDHAAVMMTVEISKPDCTRLSITSRNLRNINLEDFRHDIEMSPLTTDPCTNLDDLVDQYDNTLRSLMDKHVPETTRTITLRPHTPWYSDILRSSKRVKRRHERKWKKSGLEIDRQVFRESCNTYRHILQSAKTNYHSNQIAQCDSRKLFRMVSNMTGSSARVLPTVPEHDLVNQFANFFTGKIKDIRYSLDHTTATPISVNIDKSCTSRFGTFTSISMDAVRRIIMGTSNKSCLLDPLPTSLLKNCIDEILPVVTNIVNLSLMQGYIPRLMKSAIITPVIKKANLDSEGLHNYRPISNIPFITKVLEHAASSQLMSYIEENSLHSKIQSAYRHHHSTETAMLKVHNDLLRAVDNNKEIVLVLLDLSAAFDTIDHKLLLKRFADRYGVSDVALKWCSSYLSERGQSVAIGESVSEQHPLTYGIPQGSVIGPKQFTLYTAPIDDILAAHGIEGMVYADDTQLYTFFDPSTRDTALASMEACIADIRAWTIANKLMLNDSKTEIVHLSSRFRTTQPLRPLKIGLSYIEPVPQVRILGTMADRHLTMSRHVNMVSRNATYSIRKIGQLRKFLNRGTTEILVHAFISSKLDYCNSLLHGLPHFELAKLQRVQNTAAKLVVRAKKHDHVKPILHNLHWLPIRKRILFKSLLMVYKSLNYMAPVYIRNLLNPYAPTRSLRSSAKGLLTIPQASRTSLSSYGDRAFSIAAPKEWNKLPDDIKFAKSLNHFKKALKTYLFKLSFV